MAHLECDRLRSFERMDVTAQRNAVGSRLLCRVLFLFDGSTLLQSRWLSNQRAGRRESSGILARIRRCLSEPSGAQLLARDEDLLFLAAAGVLVLRIILHG